MKPLPLLFAALLFLLIPCRNAFCQARFPAVKYTDNGFYSGYIINMNGDTVKCDFKKPALGQLKYRPANSTEKFKKPSLEAVKEYYSSYDTTVYVAVAIDSGSSYLQYLKRLETGAIKLYEQDVTSSGTYMNGTWTGSSTTDYFYVSKNNGALKLIKSNALFTSSRKNRREYLYGLLSDDLSLAEKFKADQSFDLKTLRFYVNAYNADMANGQKSK